jgi:ferredoxin-like protein FixX
MQRESMAFDVLIVRGGPAGLAAAIRLKQLSNETTVCVVEKGTEIGAHTLSGAVMAPPGFDELMPDWRENGAPLGTLVTSKLTFDRLSSVFLSNNHDEDQPCHLTLKDATVPIAVNLAEFDAPEQRYCPADVYEIEREADGTNPRVRINSRNYVHCKTCDIKDPTQNIVWVAPQGGEGPVYLNM